MIIDEKDYRENGYSYRKKRSKIIHSESWRRNVLIRYGGYVGFLGDNGLTYVW